MGIVERKERQKTEMRSAILKAAWNQVLQSGWQSLSIRKIADAIEYSIPVVYEYFENKEAILLEFNKLGYKLLTAKLLEASAKYGKAPEQLEAMVYAYWDFAFTHKEYYQLMFGLGMPTCEQARIMPELTEFTNVIESTIAKIGEENNAKLNIFLKRQSFWSMLHGLVSINLMAPEINHKDMSREKMNKMVLKDFICGFIIGLKN